MEPGFDSSAAVYDRIAPQYDTHVSHKPSDALARSAFLDLVAQHVSLGSTLLDFGCGTGLDAFDYAQRGYRVLAYDHSPGMIAQLKHRCQRAIASGNISTCSADYSSFLYRFPFIARPHAIVSNFAVLNEIRNLEPLFDTFASHLEPPGWLIISVWNPIHWTKLTSLNGWSNALRQTNEPPIYRTKPYISYLHSMLSLLRSARQFHLVGRANAGAFVRYDAASAEYREPRWWDHPAANAGRLRRLIWQTAVHRVFGHFVFLVMRRDP